MKMKYRPIVDLQFVASKSLMRLQPLLEDRDFGGFVIPHLYFESKFSSFVKNWSAWLSWDNGEMVQKSLETSADARLRESAKSLRDWGGVISVGIRANGKLQLLPIHPIENGQYGDVREAVMVNQPTSTAALQRKLAKAFKSVGVILPDE